jgi:hypothetical protein
MAENFNSKPGTVPAQQAEKLAKNFGFLVKRLSRGEKAVGLGAILCLISFFLPWLIFSASAVKYMDLPKSLTGTSVGGWAYLLLVLMIVSLGLWYFSIGAATHAKIKHSSYQILMGTVFLTTAIVMRGLISRVWGWFLESTSQFGSEMTKNLFSFSWGWWLLALGALLIIIGALLVQKENLKG